MAWPVVVGAVVLVLSTGASGAALLLARRSSVTGLLLVGAGVAGAAALAVPGPLNREALVASACLLLVPLAVAAHPTWSWRSPVDFVTVTLITAAGAIAVLNASNGDVAEPMGFVVWVAVIAHLWWRLETSPAADRQALLWLGVTGGVVGVTGGVLFFAVESPAVLGITMLLAALVPPSMVVGVARPDVVDVRGLIVWSVVVAVALVVYVAAFVAAVSVLELATPADPSPGALALVGAVCAMGFHPLVVVLRGVVDRLLFGDRPDPLQAATRVVDRIGDDPVMALRAIREALVLPYASLRAEGTELASSGTEVTHTRTLPLSLGDDAVGEIVVGLRAGDLSLAVADEHVLRIVAPLLAQTLKSRALARGLQESRGAAIAAIAEERRRLRRDLHDGLGPTLSGVAFATDAARNQLRSDPARADELLVALRADTAGAITEIRRLVDGLRPPSLDELGLVGAVRQHVATLHSAMGAPLPVRLDVPAPLPVLPAATEVAAFRIVLEALTNVARHAAASHACVTMAVSGSMLILRITDDGTAATLWDPGVGISSMRERSEQVGGTLVVRSDPAGGLVEATIPLATASEPRSTSSPDSQENPGEPAPGS